MWFIRSLARNVAPILVLAAALAVHAAARAAEPQLVLYLNEDNPRVASALARLRLAIEEAEWSQRHAVRIEHVVVGPGSPALHATIRDALERRPAAIIAPSNVLARAAKAATREVPIIFASHQDPIREGIAASMHAPGGNVTGLTQYAPIEAKRIELLREVLPNVRRLGVVSSRWWEADPASRSFDPMLRERFGIQPVYYRADTAAELERAIREQGANVDAWYVTNEPAFAEPAAVAQAINATRKPAIYTMSLVTAHGGLMSYQAVDPDPFATFAKLLGRVLDGRPAGTIPVEGPKVFELQLHQATADRLGIAFPRSLLVRATRIHGAPGPVEKSSPVR